MQSFTKCVSWRALPALFALAGGAGISLAAAQTPDFETDVRPILEQNCFECHGVGARLKGNLDLTRRATILRGGDQGAAVNLETPGESLLLDMISYRDEHHQMPPPGKLPDGHITILKNWITRGLVMPDEVDVARETPAAPPPRFNNKINDASRNWWSYRPLTRPEPPRVDSPFFIVNPIDTFIQAALTDAGLTPAVRADRRSLIRRACYDLTGLPPTPEQVEAFAQNPSSRAYEDLIDELLASPHYGEKWGRHWLDLVRYAETNGYERDSVKPFIWRYRDYVIDAFNQDKPYDRFVDEQLAGDELPDGGEDGLVATAFYRLGIWDDEPADKAQGRYDTLDGIVDTTSQVFLGTTMGCARCHDHKIDPLPQRDYYKMLSFFQNITDMHVTDITRSIATDAERGQYDQAVKENRRRIRATERRIEKIEKEFVAALLEAEPDLRGNVHTSDMTAMRYRFYRDTYQALPDFDHIKHEDEGTLDHNFFDLSPRTRNDSYGFVFEAALNVPETADYTVYLDSDDGSRLLIDGAAVLTYDGFHAVGEKDLSATVHLTEGAHPIRLEFFQGGGESGLVVSWSGPGFERRLLSNTDAALDVPTLLESRGDELLGADGMKRLVFLRNKLKREREYVVPGNREAAVVAEHGPEAPPTHILLRGNPHVEGDEVSPGFPEVLGYDAPEIPPAPEDAPTTGRRKVLADWITREDNPLTARVMANRIWQYHFGRGIVRTPNDFGQAGEAPSHPELLDWLAAEFIEGGWRMKRMHRMIMLSYTYQMASEMDDENYAKDPRNDHFWRFDMRRLDSEEIRDSILAVNGTLNPKLGGPSVFPPMPEAALATSSRPGEVWGVSPEAEHSRRSVYIHLKRSLVTPLLQDFDQADTDSSCPVRFVTTQPTQALNMLNSQYLYEEAETFAERLLGEAGPELDSQVRRALELATTRPATDEEVDQGVAFVTRMQQEHGLSPEVALDRFSLLVLNLNEFIFLD